MKVLKIFSKADDSPETDSIFSIIGRSEPDLTKSLAALLYHDEDFLKAFLKLIKFNYFIGKGDLILYAEQLADKGKNKIRRDITMELNYNQKKTLIVIEAKNPFTKENKNQSTTRQLNKYFDPLKFGDLNQANEKIGIILLKEKVKSVSAEKNYDKFLSITWEEIFIELENLKSKKNLAGYFKEELKRANFMKTYDSEVFCPPCGDSYKNFLKYHIYFCPAERSLKKSIYLMPRIPVKGNHPALKKSGVNIEIIKEMEGHGFALELYRIKDSFIAESGSLKLIKDQKLRKNIEIWMNESQEERLKVYDLEIPSMKFANPKFTEGKNNSYQGYYNLKEIWGDIIPKKTPS